MGSSWDLNLGFILRFVIFLLDFIVFVFREEIIFVLVGCFEDFFFFRYWEKDFLEFFFYIYIY